MSKILFCLLTIFIFTNGNLFKTSAKNVLRGTLLKSNSKPLPYIEIELVPINSRSMINDGRLTAISVPSGKFSFIDVPNGEYTLSINYGEKPTELSPYAAFFFPKAETRRNAKTFQFTGDSLIEGVSFQLPPPLVAQKITGRIVNFIGLPLSEAFVNLRDLEFDAISFVLESKTNKAGEFSFKGFKGRRYEVAFMIPGNIPQGNIRVEIIAEGRSEPFILDEKTPSIVIKVKLPDDPNINEKNIGRIIRKDINSLLSYVAP